MSKELNDFHSDLPEDQYNEGLSPRPMKIKPKDLRVEDSPTAPNIVKTVWLGPERVAHINLPPCGASLKMEVGHEGSFLEATDGGACIKEALEIITEILNK